MGCEADVVFAIVLTEAATAPPFTVSVVTAKGVVVDVTGGLGWVST